MASVKLNIVFSPPTRICCSFRCCCLFGGFSELIAGLCSLLCVITEGLGSAGSGAEVLPNAWSQEISQALWQTLCPGGAFSSQPRCWHPDFLLSFLLTQSLLGPLPDMHTAVHARVTSGSQEYSGAFQSSS